MAGDFITILEHKLDRSLNSRAAVNLKMSDKVRSIMQQWGLCEIWRCKDGSKKGLPYYNKKYKHKSRIDYFWVDHAIKDDVVVVEHIGVHLSDHSAIRLDVRLKKGTTSSIWRLDRTILCDSETIEILKEETKEFFKRNQGSAKIGIVWDAYKAFLSGRLGTLAAGKRQINYRRVSDLEEQIQKLEAV